MARYTPLDCCACNKDGRRGAGRFLRDGKDLVRRGKHLFVCKHDAFSRWKDLVSVPKHPRPNAGKACRRTNDFLREAPTNGRDPLPRVTPVRTGARLLTRPAHMQCN